MTTSIGKAAYPEQNNVDIVVDNVEQNIKDSWFREKIP